MAERAAQAHLSGERVVGVNATGAISVVVGLVGAPSLLWGDMLIELRDRPAAIAHLKVRGRDPSRTEPPTQIDLQVGSTADIREALDWLVDAIVRTNENHYAHQNRLATIYAEAVTSVEDWYEDAQASGTARQDPTRN